MGCQIVCMGPVRLEGLPGLASPGPRNSGCIRCPAARLASVASTSFAREDLHLPHILRQPLAQPGLSDGALCSRHTSGCIRCPAARLASVASTSYAREELHLPHILRHPLAQPGLSDGAPCAVRACCTCSCSVACVQNQLQVAKPLHPTPWPESEILHAQTGHYWYQLTAVDSQSAEACVHTQPQVTKLGHATALPEDEILHAQIGLCWSLSTRQWLLLICCSDTCVQTQPQV